MSRPSSNTRVINSAPHPTKRTKPKPRSLGTTSCERKLNNLEKDHRELEKDYKELDKDYKMSEDVIDKCEKAYKILEKDHRELEKEHKELDKEHKELDKAIDKYLRLVDSIENKRKNKKNNQTRQNISNPLHRNNSYTSSNYRSVHLNK